MNFFSCTMDFFYTPRIFSINSCCACLNIANVGMVFSKYMDKRSLCFQVHGYYKVIINVSIKYSPYVNKYYLCIITFPHMTNIWLHIKNWHLIYISHHFSIITKFFNTLKVCWYTIIIIINTLKTISWKLTCTCV